MYLNILCDNLDTDDDLECESNRIDCTGICDGTAFEDNCGNCSAVGYVPGYQSNGNELFVAYNEKYDVETGFAIGVDEEQDGIADSEFFNDSMIGNICSCDDSLTDIDDFLVWDCAGECGGDATFLLL